MSGQTKLETIVETLLGSLLHWVLSILIYILIFPLFGINVPLLIIPTLSLISIAIHGVKSYYYRRVWNYLLIKGQQKSKRRKNG